MQYTSWIVSFIVCFTFNFILCHSGLLCLWISTINSWPLKEITPPWKSFFNEKSLESWSRSCRLPVENIIGHHALTIWLNQIGSILFHWRRPIHLLKIYEILARIGGLSIISTWFLTRCLPSKSRCHSICCLPIILHMDLGEETFSMLLDRQDRLCRTGSQSVWIG